MVEAFLQPGMAPFAVAIGLMLIISAVEIVGALMGMPASAALDSLLPEIDADIDLDFEADYAGGPLDVDAPGMPDAPSAGPLSQILGWLCVGKVPVLVLLIVFLTAFGLVGFVVQGTTTAVFGAPLPTVLAVIPAFFAAMPVVRVSGLTLAKVMPKEQTEAVSQKRFIGKVAVIIRGSATKGKPAEGKFSDRHGQMHYALIEPDAEDETFNQGDEVILVKQSGSVFQAIRNVSAAMSDANIAE